MAIEQVKGHERTMTLIKGLDRLHRLTALFPYSKLQPSGTECLVCMPWAASRGKFIAISAIDRHPEEMLLGPKYQSNCTNAASQSGWECRGISDWSFKHSAFTIIITKFVHRWGNGIL